MIADGIGAGLWLLGALLPLAAIALVVLIVLALDVPHRIRVAKLRRETKRAGRATDGASLGANWRTR